MNVALIAMNQFTPLQINVPLLIIKKNKWMFYGC